MPGRFEREHVRHLVPQRAAPVKLAGGAARWTVHRDHVTERHAEQSDAWQRGDAHGEVIVIRVELERDRLAWLECRSDARTRRFSGAPVRPRTASAPAASRRCNRSCTSNVSPRTVTGFDDSSNSSMRSSSRSEFTVVGLYGSPEYAAVRCRRASSICPRRNRFVPSSACADQRSGCTSTARRSSAVASP